jgi:glycerol-3-phosphate acyltransferase PlsY
MFNAILFIILGYLLGSVPFGYIFSKISGKDVLKIGWRKTSGSNVFKNVGAWQGLLTGLGDVGKGFLAVCLAQNFGEPVQVQVFCGVAAVTGHNWSVFLKFAGGRGIGTLIGAFLALSPTILGLSIIFLIGLALVWNAAIGTIFFLAAAIIIATVSGQLETVGLLPLVSLLPVFIKRLSPVKELFSKGDEDKSSSLLFARLRLARVNKGIIRNRLIFDDDIPRWDLRIKRIIQRLTKA